MALIALKFDLPHVVIRDLNGRARPVVDGAVTLGMTYGLAFGTASIVNWSAFISKMQEARNQFRLVWQSDLSIKANTENMNALVLEQVNSSRSMKFTRRDLRCKNYFRACLPQFNDFAGRSRNAKTIFL